MASETQILEQGRFKGLLGDLLGRFGLTNKSLIKIEGVDDPKAATYVHLLGSPYTIG